MTAIPLPPTASRLRSSATDPDDQLLAQPSINDGTRHLLEQALNSSSIGILIVAMTTGQPIVYVNRGFEHLTGYSADEVLGRNCNFLQGQDTDQCGLPVIRQSLQAGQECRVTLRNYRKDGQMFWNELYLSPIRDATGQVTHYLGIQTDICALHAAAEQRDQLAEQIRLLLESTGDGMIGVDVNGNSTFVNRAAADILGFEPGELLGKNCHHLLHHSYADLRPYPESECPIQQSVRDGVGRRIEDEVFWHKNGQPIDVTYSASPLVRDGIILGAVITFSNNTERRQAEESLRLARQEAIAANQAKSQFLARMSHELRTPISTVLGMTRLLLDTRLTGVQREYLSLLGKSAGDLLHIINDILDLSRIEAGRLDLALEPFDLPGLVGDLMQALEVQAYPKGIRLIFDIAQAVPQIVIGDPLRLRQILSNLLGNAIKFTVQGEVLLTLKRVRSKNGRVQLRFAVTDTGVGIAEAQQSHIFDAFHQGEAAASRHPGGAGLGLSITRTLVQLMNGSIQVKSMPGQGSTFTFTAQFDMPGAESRSATRDTADLAGLRALVVEANATARRVLCRQLRRYGLHPVAATSASRAMAQVRRAARDGQPFACMLIDQHLPEMDGGSLAQRLYAAAGQPPQRLILLHSAGALPEVPMELTRLRKPIKEDELLAALNGAPRAQRDLPGDETGRRSFRGRSVLVVEDNIANQKVIEALLMRHDIHVTVVDHGQAAIDYLRRAPVDLVFMDIQLPGFDGLETTLQIRRNEAGSGRHTPVIALTAHAQTGEAERCLGAGMDGYLSKPIRMQQLTAVLETWLTWPLALPAGAAAGLPAILDLTYLGGLFHNAPQTICDMLAVYIDSVTVLLGEIEDAHAAREPERILHYAHQIKGASLSTGALRVAAACAAVEQLFKAANQSGITPAITRLASAINETLTAIRAYLDAANPSPPVRD